MHTFKNILFDLGGVFIPINYQATEKAFIEAGITNFPALYSQHHASPLFEALETGKIKPAVFWDELQALANVKLPIQVLEAAWNAMLGDFDIHLMDWLTKVAKQYPIYLFSNTNLIHYEAFTTKFRNQLPGKNFDDFFIKAWYSHQVGVRKPYPSSFLQLLHSEQLVANETLFIDDTYANIEGAKSAGLQTFWLKNTQDLFNLIRLH